jgi:hypothetical protein
MDDVYIGYITKLTPPLPPQKKTIGLGKEKKISMKFPKT